MPIEDFEEFKNDLTVLRDEIKAKGTNVAEVDVALVAAWVDRVVIMLERLTERLALLNERVDVLSEKK
ncbi:MAG: hypothetical protein ACE5FW_00015 [Candidatus Aenigmatarchaeota archaeon]